MADYIYLLENRLSANQKSALEKIRAVVRERGMTLFLVGGAVRDLTAGTSVRDLDVAVQGNALKLKKDIQKAGGTFSGEYEPTQSLFFDFPGSVRMEISSTLGVTYDRDVAQRTNMPRQPGDVSRVTVTQDQAVMERTNMGGIARGSHNNEPIQTGSSK